MVEAPQNKPVAGTDSHLIAFEQPLSKHEGSYGARAAIGQLLEMLAITSRGDVRTDALKELDRHMLRLTHFQRSPGVDAERLARLMAEVDATRQALLATGKQFLAPLRENEFLNAIRHRSSIPGGTCMFDLPDYGYWLNLPASERSNQLSTWLSKLKPLSDSIDQILWLTREASAPTEQIAVNGLYNHNFGKEEHCELVRVLVAQGSGLYPEISAGQHRVTVRFAKWQGTEQRAKQAAEDVSFQLAFC
jgi:cell division protein ZapD